MGKPENTVVTDPFTGEKRRIRDRTRPLTDHDIMAAQSTSALADAKGNGRRVYVATYEHQTNLGLTTRRFAAYDREDAALFAREYAARIQPYLRLVDIRWDR